MSMSEQLLRRVRSLEMLKTALSQNLQMVDDELNAALAELKREQDETAELRKLLKHNKFYHDKKTHCLAEYFKGKGYLITEIGEVSETSKAKYALAKHILISVDVFEPWLRFIYERKENVYSIDELEGSAKTAVCNFCTQLKKMGWLEWSKDKKSITIDRKIPKTEYSFFNGGWAEDATRYLIERTLHDSNVKCRAIYRGVKLEKYGVERNKDIHEFDLIVEFKDRFYIFETKSGATLGVERWIDHARLFNDLKGGNKFIMCCNDDAVDARLFRPYRLFHLNSIANEFSEMLKKEFLAENKTSMI